MIRLSPFSLRALVALLDGERTDRELASAMRLSSTTSVLSELESHQLIRARITDRATRPWTWSYSLTPAGRLEAEIARDLELQREQLHRLHHQADGAP